MTTPTRRKVPRETQIRHLRVAEATRKGPFVRIILQGEELEGFESTGPTDHCKLFISDGGGEQGRHYTPLLMADGTIAFDIVTHGGNGVIAAWADRLPVGDTVKIGGPRSSLEFPVGASNIVLLGDSSAFPPMSRWLGEKPAGMRADVVLHGDGGDYFDEIDGTTFHHVPFDVSGAGMLESVQRISMDEGTYVWAGGEATSLVPLRKWLRGVSPVVREGMKIDGYWKQGVVDRDHHAPLDPEEGE